MLRSALSLALLLSVRCVSADTAIGGTVATSSWTLANSPYRVTSAVVVPMGDTLTIDPGVTVLFDANVPLTVSGKLLAEGTATDSVRFVAGAASSWGGIEISYAQRCTFSYVRISGGHKDGQYVGGGGLLIDHSVVSVDHSVISDNSLDASALYSTGAGAYGGGIQIVGSVVDLLDCSIINNSAGGHYSNTAGNQYGAGVGGGVWIDSLSEVRIAASRIVGNSANWEAGGIYSASLTHIENSVLAANDVGVYSSVATPNPPVCYQLAHASLVNCTLADNMAYDAYRNPGELFSTSDISLVNCIVWSDTTIISLVPKLPTLPIPPEYCDIGPAADTLAVNSIAADPLFNAPASGDYSLRSGSPCIDAGDPSSPRDADGTVADMGVSDNLRSRSAIEVMPALAVRSGAIASLEVGNGGDAALTVSSVTLPDSFETTATFPRTVPAFGEISLPIVFTGRDSVTAAATIACSDTVRGTQTVALFGQPLSLLNGRYASLHLVVPSSPYHVIGPVAADQVTIDPGVDVVFDSTLAQFAVSGSLSAIGTASDSIRFVSGTVPYWGGLRIHGPDSSSLAYVRVSGGKNKQGGGIGIVGAPVTLSHCVVTRNYGSGVQFAYTGAGAGMYVGGGASVSLDSCDVSYNVNGPLDYEGDGTEGGGLYVASSSVIATSTRIVGNDVVSGPWAGPGGGIAYSDASVTLRNCVVRLNYAGTASGGIFGTGTLVLDRTLLDHDYASHSNTEIRAFGTATVTRCTIVGSGADVVNTDTTNVHTHIANSIIWNLPVDSGVVVTYSDVQGGFPGVGNISADPMFRDSTNGDFRLWGSSPCIDAGDPASPPDPDGTRADMGAYPFDHHDTTAVGPTPVTALRTVCPNPFNPSTTISYSLAQAEPVSIVVYDLLGQPVRKLVDGTISAGDHSAVWYGLDGQGRQASSGVYLVRMKAPGYTRTIRTTLVR